MTKIQFCWLIEPSLIKIIINGAGDLKGYQLYDQNHLSKNCTIIKEETIEGIRHLYLKPDQEIFLQQNCYFRQGISKFYLYPTREFLNKECFSTKQMGSILHKEYVQFRLWSPTAREVKLHLYYKGGKKFLFSSKMTRDENGVWEYKLNKSHSLLDELHEISYSYEVKAFGRKYPCLDPYAQSMEEFQFQRDNNQYQPPRSIVINKDKSTPENFKISKKSNNDLLATPLSFIGYEAHIRDFTISPDSPVEEELKGTYLGFSKLTNYFKNLGVTHIQLLPIQKFHTVDESDRSLQDNKKDQNLINYNWGYDPLNFFTPEGWYSTDSSNPSARITELKSMVQAFHQENIGIVMDVVFNHIYDERILEFVAPGCYLRREVWGDISGHTGAGSTIESRTLMVRKLIIDSLTYFQKEFHINGFRFDLMSFIDHETMIEIRKSLGQDCILYGEGWNFTDLPNNQATTKTSYPQNIKLGFFNDSCRDSLIGHKGDHGIIHGNIQENLKLKSAILAGVIKYSRDYNKNKRVDVILGEDPYNYFSHEPINCYNFLDIHDGFTLWDKINISFNEDESVKKDILKQSLTTLFSMQGPLVLHGGVEMGRTKPSFKNDPSANRAHHSDWAIETEGTQTFHENSYRSSDFTNMIRWERADSFKDIYEHVKKLSTIKKEISELRYQKTEDINSGLRFIEKKPIASKHGILDFNKFPKLIINFINGVPEETFYLVGEVFPNNVKNPLDNPYALKFNSEGIGQIIFKQEQIELFDTKKWGYDNDLQIKLIKTPGQWDTINYAYSTFGYNLIAPFVINDKFEVTIDLGLRDFQATIPFIHDPLIITYSLDSFDRKDCSTLVIHNFSSENKVVFIESKISKEVTIDDPIHNMKHNNSIKISKKTSYVLQLNHCKKQYSYNLKPS